MDFRRLRYLHAMGIRAWSLRDSSAAGNASPEPAVVPEPRGGDGTPVSSSPAGAGNEAIARLDWDALQARVADCTACELHRGRTQTVFGTGSHTADWMIVGEAPGAEEDRRGEPFVGRAGQLLDNMLIAVGLDRQSVYIANILKCRPPGNRDPQAGEVNCCMPYLQRQITLLGPRLILAVGRVAAQNLLGTDAPTGRLRGRVHEVEGVPVVVTYHPAYLLRSPGEKRKAWEDLQLARSVASGAS